MTAAGEAAPAVLFRADAGARQGAGHVMRCHALAEALAERGVIGHLAAVALPDALAGRLRASGLLVHRLAGPAGGDGDLAETLALAARLRAGAVVVDGYGFGPSWRQGLARAGRCVLAFDDLADTPLHADLVVNAAPDAGALPYARVAAGAQCLLGPAYAPLRREIREAARAAKPPVAERRAVLVTFGGSDPLGLTGPCVEGLAAALPEAVRLDVAVGGANPQADRLAALAARLGPAGRLAVHHDTPHMGRLMAAAGLAVSAAGTTTGELAAVGVPAVLVVVVGNQERAADGTARIPWCERIDGRGDAAAARIVAAAVRLWGDPARRTAMAAAARGIVDGEGAPRIADALCRRLTAP
ncbi:UDP-2,4-diacetamido-2,4,6-trideoxy-beta-L-altropyranose hydrolase [Azospirillum sp. A39]|uniref:UDP-2,4-diacetamido-2,4, 6-trideoxy-beta-L-altropyranose hydrolase n=1 Tax=Azospirillum sp. A39 TaxID=3462279 RepID=UPI0040460246